MHWVPRFSIRGPRRWWLRGALAALVLYVGVVTALLVLRPFAASDGSCPILTGGSAPAADPAHLGRLHTALPTSGCTALP